MSQYKTLSNQSVFDVCIKTVGDFTNLFDVITQFRDVNNDVPIGETVEYTKSKTIRQFSNKIPIVNSGLKSFFAVDYQSVYDVAIQLLGDFSRIDEILPIIRNLGTKITVGTTISYTPTKDPVSLFFTNKVVATAFYLVSSIDNARLLEDGSYRLLEDGSYRLLE